MASKHRISLNLTEEEYREVAALAEKARVSRAWIGRQALIEFYKQMATDFASLAAWETGLTQDEFERLLTVAAQILTENIGTNPDYRSPAAFERHALDMLKVAGRDCELTIEPSFHPHAFPDIRANGYGIEDLMADRRRGLRMRCLRNIGARRARDRTALTNGSGGPTRSRPTGFRHRRSSGTVTAKWLVVPFAVE